jgi:hypothetical protein
MVYAVVVLLYDCSFHLRWRWRRLLLLHKHLICLEER